MIKRYRKKPVVINAARLDRHTRSAIQKWIGRDAWFYDSNGEAELYIQTLEGVMVGSEGDFIVEGVNGEFYPVKPDIFAKTYEDA